jgi:hypothetical protein
MIVTEFSRLKPRDVFIAVNEVDTELVPMRVNESGVSATPYGRGGDVRHGAVQLWPSGDAVFYPPHQQIIKLKITPDE